MADPSTDSAVASAREALRAGEVDRAQELLEQIERDRPEGPALVRLRAEVLEARGGRSPTDAAERARAHAAAALASEDRARDAHLRAMFRALVRVAELEGPLPEPDPRMPAGRELHAALRAHLRWRRGGPPEEAAAAYAAVLERVDLPEVLRPYVLYWLGHIQGVAEDLEGALATYRTLLDVGPPGSRGREDVEARIRKLEERRESSELTRVLAEVEELRGQGRGQEAVEVLETALHRTGRPGEVLQLRRTLARVLMTLGEAALARAEWERVRALEEGEGAEADEEPGPAPGPDPDDEPPPPVE